MYGNSVGGYEKFAEVMPKKHRLQITSNMAKEAANRLAGKSNFFIIFYKLESLIKLLKNFSWSI